MKILVPTDFSLTADKALRYAIDYYRQPGVTFLLYHSFMPFESGFYNPEKSREDNNATERDLHEQLGRTAQPFARAGAEDDIWLVVDRGVAEGKILAYAAAQRVDLIIMGSTGAGGLREKVVGSVTADIMNEARCPVIGIPAQYQPQRPQHIAFCSNYSLTDMPALRYLTGLLDRFDATLQIWHFEKTPRQPETKNNLAEEHKILVNNLLSPRPVSFHVDQTDSIESALEKMAQRQDLDLIVMITRERNGFFAGLLSPSLTKKVAYRAQTPLMAIPKSFLT